MGGVRESRRTHEQVLDHHSRHRDPIVADRLVSALLARVVQSDALAGCGERSVAGGSTSSLLTDAALGRAGSPRQSLVQETPQHRSNTRPTPSPCHAAVVISADIDFLPAVEMAVGVFQCPVATAFTFFHVGYKLHDLLSGPIPNLFTFEVSEEELRHAMLPREMVLPNGRKIEFQKMKNSHFARMKGMGG